MKQVGAREELYPYVTGLASMIIIKMGAQTLNPEISKAITFSTLMVAAKPYLTQAHRKQKITDKE